MKKSTCFLIAAASFLVGLALSPIGQNIIIGNNNSCNGYRGRKSCGLHSHDDLDLEIEDCEDDDALYSGCDDISY